MTTKYDSILREYVADTVIADVPIAMPRTRTRATIPIPRESMAQVVGLAKGTPADGIRVEVVPPDEFAAENDTAPYARVDVEALVAECRTTTVEMTPAQVAALAMTASTGEPATVAIVRAIVRAKRERGVDRAEVSAALLGAGLHRLSFMHVGKGTEIFGAQPGSPSALTAIPAGDRVAHLLVRVNCEWVPYRVGSARDAALLAREVRS